MEDRIISQDEIDQMEESPAAKPTIELVNGYKYIENGCEHFPKGIAINIFPCCNNPYPCYQCHELVEAHKYSGASQGYCRLCKTWYVKRSTYCAGCNKSFS